MKFRPIRMTTQKTQRNPKRDVAVKLAAQCLHTENQCGLHVMLDDGNYGLAEQYYEDVTTKTFEFARRKRFVGGGYSVGEIYLSEGDVNAAKTILQYYCEADPVERRQFRKSLKRKYEQMFRVLFAENSHKPIPNMEYWSVFDIKDLKVVHGIDAVYWNGHGEEQPYVAMLNQYTPNIGSPTTEPIDLFIAIQRVYYDIYNNGGGNLFDRDQPLKAYVDTVKKAIAFDLRKAADSKTYLEEKTTEAFRLVKSHPLDEVLNFPIYTVYQNWDGSTLAGYAKNNKFKPVTFADEKDMLEWIGHRLNNWNWKWIPKPGGSK